MKHPKKQVLYALMVPHENTMQGAFLWWINRKNKHCRKFCPTCKYYFLCQEITAREELMGRESKCTE